MIEVLITMSNYMTFLTTNLTSRNVSAKTKNARTRAWLNLIRSWTRLVMTTTSTTTLKLRASIAKITTVGEDHIRTIETTSGTMETTMIAIKTPH